MVSEQIYMRSNFFDWTEMRLKPPLLRTNQTEMTSDETILDRNDLWFDQNQIIIQTFWSSNQLSARLNILDLETHRVRMTLVWSHLIFVWHLDLGRHCIV